jgi:hypothetical protein
MSNVPNFALDHGTTFHPGRVMTAVVEQANKVARSGIGSR